MIQEEGETLSSVRIAEMNQNLAPSSNRNLAALGGHFQCWKGVYFLDAGREIVRNCHAHAHHAL